MTSMLLSENLSPAETLDRTPSVVPRASRLRSVVVGERGRGRGSQGALDLVATGIGVGVCNGIRLALLLGGAGRHHLGGRLERLALDLLALEFPQTVGDLPHARSKPAVVPPTLANDGRDGRRDAFGQRRPLALEAHGHDDLHDVVALRPRDHAGDAFPEDASERVAVALVVDLGSGELLRRHVPGEGGRAGGRGEGE